MKKIVLSVLLIGIVVVTSVGTYLAVSESGGRASASIPPATSIVSRNTNPDPGVIALNAVVDASGLKEKIDGALRANAGEISERLSISEPQVNTAIDTLDIENWEVANLPEGTAESARCDVECEGVDIEVVTYVDPAYVTVGMHGQNITFAVPESAQGSVSLLTLLA